MVWLFGCIVGKLCFSDSVNYLVIGVCVKKSFKKMPVKSVAKRQRGESSKTKDAGPNLNVFVSVAAKEQYNNFHKNRACI